MEVPVFLTAVYSSSAVRSIGCSEPPTPETPVTLRPVEVTVCIWGIPTEVGTLGGAATEMEGVVIVETGGVIGIPGTMKSGPETRRWSFLTGELCIGTCTPNVSSGVLKNFTRST